MTLPFLALTVGSPRVEWQMRGAGRVDKPVGDRERWDAGAGQAEHLPVLYAEALDWLDPRSGGRYVDCTVGLGGHSRGILERSSPDGRLLGIDADASALVIARARLADFGSRLSLVHATFDRLEELARAESVAPADGVIFDLGVSSLELDRPERGFSLRVDAPLDMRFDQGAGPTAAQLLASLGEEELADVIYQYGEEPRSRGIARAIVAAGQ
jgi:16S rRNA (cytosine1402-N4)-methyltransferase